MTIKKLVAAAAAAAGLLTLAVAPMANAAQATDAEGSHAVTSIPGVKLIPFTGKKNARVAAAAADTPAYLIQSAWVPRCLDADPDGLGANGAKITLWDCNTSYSNQAFYITQNPQGYYRFQNVANGQYLDASMGTIGANGTKVQLWSFVASGKNQWWAVTVNDQDHLRFQNAQSGRYLDASLHTPGGGVNGTKVQLWDFQASASHQWWD